MLLIAKGRSCYEVARWFGQDPRTIERGVGGLREHYAGGRSAKVVGEQVQSLARDLLKPPRVSGYYWSRNGAGFLSDSSRYSDSCGCKEFRHLR